MSTPLSCRNHERRRPTRHIKYVDGHGITYDVFLCRECAANGEEPSSTRRRRCDGECGAGESYHRSLLTNPASEWSRTGATP